MKRRNFTGGALLLGLIGGACTAPRREAAPAAGEAGGWVAPPVIEAVERGPASLVVRGRMAPLGRMVVRGAGDVAYAAGADDRGRFELRVAAPATDALFVVETRVGQEAAPAPYRLLISRDPAGPVALLAPGAASRRLDRGGALDVVDSDGRAVLISGRAGAGDRVPVSVGDDEVIEAEAGPDGRWSLMRGAAGDRPAEIVVAGRRYLYPGPGPIGGGLVVERVDDGWRSSWSLSPDSRQSSWFPTAA